MDFADALSGEGLTETHGTKPSLSILTVFDNTRDICEKLLEDMHLHDAQSKKGAIHKRKGVANESASRGLVASTFLASCCAGPNQRDLDD